MRPDSVDHGGIFSVLFSKLHSQQGMAELGLFIGHFTDIVEKPGPFSQFGIHAELGGHDTAKIGHFPAVHEQVLAVGRAETHLAYYAYQLLMQPMDTQLDHRALPDLHDLLFDLFAGLFHHLLDAGGMDASVGNQPL